MGKFIVRRLLQMVLVLVGATLILFAALFIVPGDPVGSLGGGGRARDPAVVATLRHRYALDKPLPVQYLRYVSRLVRGDMGESFSERRPVSAVLKDRFKNTAELATAALALEMVIGLSAGIVAAVLRYSPWDLGTTLVTTIAIGFPTFVIGLIFQHVFAFELHWFPLSGVHGSVLRSVFLPALTLAAVDAALVARLMRGTMLEVLRADYIRTARSKGLPERTVILKHALRNSIVPVVTYLGIAFGTLLGGALITEVIFNWNGIGYALVTAIQTQDNPVVLGVATWGVAAFVVVNLVVDIVYGFLDPRIRLQ
jgi:ABC-type dipeptide/oligopeptide/nickel transport system permease component